jgi:predicted small lipoprotein YifL
MKKLFSLFLALVLLTLTLTACGGGKPAVEELRPRGI